VAVAGRLTQGLSIETREGAWFLDPGDVVARLTSPSGQQLVLPAQSAFHIQATYMGASATSRFNTGSLAMLLSELGRRVPPEIIYDCREARLEFDLEATIGSDIVASRR
jgi:hypothetical protein